ncbi:putative reverse transcriptase domain-containing protein [Tanacetum coccineum]
MSTTYHPQTDGQSERTIQILEDMLKRAPQLRGKLGYSSYHYTSFSYTEVIILSLDVSPFEALYGRKCHSSIMWAEEEGGNTPRFVGPFEIVEKVGPVAYRLDLSEELSGVHDTFHVSNLKKFLADLTLQVPLDAKESS